MLGKQFSGEIGESWAFDKFWIKEIAESSSRSFKGYTNQDLNSETKFPLVGKLESIGSLYSGIEVQP